MRLTVLLVVEAFDLSFDRPVECLLDESDRERRRERAVQEVARARPLHDLRARVARQLAEAIVAEDDRLVVDLRVRDDEVPI